MTEVSFKETMDLVLEYQATERQLRHERDLYRSLVVELAHDIFARWEPIQPDWMVDWCERAEAAQRQSLEYLEERSTP